VSKQYDPSNILNSEGCVYVRYEVYAALEAENERLRKAGDALSYALQTCKYSAEEIAHYSDAWTEAKK